MPNGFAMFGEDISITIVFPFPTEEEPYLSFSFRILLMVSSNNFFLSRKKFIYGPFASTFSNSFELIFSESSWAIWTGDFFRVFAREKQGKAKSPSSGEGGISNKLSTSFGERPASFDNNWMSFSFIV